MQEIVRELTIKNKNGLHARPASQLVHLASKFSSDILFARGRETVNAKSIMGVLMLAVAQGTTIKIIARGDDAPRAMNEIENLIKSKFGEK